MKNETIAVTPEKLSFNSFTIYDTLAHKATIDGYVGIKSFNELQFNNWYKLIIFVANFNDLKLFQKIRNQKIHKIQLIKIDFDMINTVTKYKLLGVLELIRLQGGELEAITNLSEAFKKGEITKKQKHDLHQLIKDATSNKLYTKQSDEILELDNKVNESVKYYR